MIIKKTKTLNITSILYKKGVHCVKRKIIQIADSTQLVSLPRKWCQRLNIKKGDEIDIEEKGNKLIVSTKGNKEGEKIEFDIKHLEPMTARFIHALYKRGIDEIKINFDKPAELEIVQKALGKETVGYEIVEQSKNFCVVKNVSGDLEDFEQILRRTFLLLITMADDGLVALKARSTADLTNLLPLEESNNRFTTTCRRYLNKKGHPSASVIGPLYYIIEDLEKIADHYKYLYSYFIDNDIKKMKMGEQALAYFEKTNKLLKLFYELFYKPDKEKIAEIGKIRKELVKEWYTLLGKLKEPADILIYHIMLTIIQEVFNLTGPFLAFNTNFKLR